MKLSNLLTVCTLSGFLLVSAVSQAGQGGHHKTHFLLSEKAAVKLNLTKEQQNKIADILKEKKTAMMAFKETRKDSKDEFKALVENDYFDEQQAKALIAKSSVAKDKALLAKLKSKQQIWQVLDQEQREKLAKIKHYKRKRSH